MKTKLRFYPNLPLELKPFCVKIIPFAFEIESYSRGGKDIYLTILSQVFVLEIYTDED